MVLFLMVSLVLAGMVAIYVAYPHRGEPVPHAPWLGEAMKRGVEALPTLAEPDVRPDSEVGSRDR